MINRGLFKKPGNKLEGGINDLSECGIPDELCVKCTACGKMIFTMDLKSLYFVCPECGNHFPVSCRDRIKMIADENTFEEMYEDIISENIIGFPEYEKKLNESCEKSGENEAVLCGKCTVSGIETCIFVMNYEFMMGSMGKAVGEKITLLFEYATEHKMPVLGYTLSGGARMQEGIFSLMQMAKTSAAVKRHSDAGQLYIAVLTNPTTGGVSASFAMEGDIILAEPDALIGFAGPRVIEQTIGKKLPKGFQRAEFVMETGFIDKIVSRDEQKKIISKIIELHYKEDLV